MLRFLTATLGLALYLNLFGLPVRAMLLPPTETAAVSLQNDLAAETDSTGDDSGAGTDDSGSGDDEPSSDDDSD